MIKFQLITPERIVYEHEVYEVIVPTISGQISIFPNHIPMVSLVASGVLSLRNHQGDSNDQLEHVAVTGGAIQINGSLVKVLADSADKSDEVDELKAKEAYEHAIKLKKESRDKITLADATAAIERSLAQIKLSQIIKHRHHKG